MAEERVSSISQSRTLEEMAEFWDTHSTADYDHLTYEVEMTFEPSARRSSVGIEAELLTNLRQVAIERRVTVQTLVNVWLTQRLEQLKGQTPLPAT